MEKPVFGYFVEEEDERRGHIAIPTHHPLPPRPFGGITFTAQTDLVLPLPSSYYFSAKMRKKSKNYQEEIQKKSESNATIQK